MEQAWPVLRIDEEAERFVAEADLTEYDFAQMVPVQFELRRKDKAVSLRLSDALLEAVKRKPRGRASPISASCGRRSSRPWRLRRRRSGDVWWRSDRVGNAGARHDKELIDINGTSYHRR